MSDYTHIWEAELTEREKHLLLYAKTQYEWNDDIRDDVRVIYAMNNDVLVSDRQLFQNFVHRTLVKVMGPEAFTEYAGTFLSDIFRNMGDYPNGYPEDLFEAYISRMQMEETGGERPDWLPDHREWPVLKDVTPKRIDNDRLPAVEPRDYAIA